MLGPIVGYNFSVNPRASVMVHASVFTATGDMEDSDGFEADIEGHGYMLGGLFNYFLTDSVALSAGLRLVDADFEYSYSGTTLDADLKETGVSAGLSAFF